MSESEDIPKLKKKVKKLLKKCKWSQAEQILIKIKILNPDNVEMNSELTKIYQHALNKHFTIPEVHYRLGKLLLSMSKEMKKALKHFDIALRNDSNNIRYIIHTAQVATKLKLFLKANSLFIKALEITNEQDPKVLYNYGVFFYHQNDLQCAFLYMKLALQLDSTNITYYLEHAKIAAKLQYYDEANKSFIKTFIIKQLRNKRMRNNMGMGGQGQG
eukprot:272052_1